LETSQNHENPRGRILRIPHRKDVWLFPYKDIKYTTRLQWRLHLILGVSTLILGTLALVALLQTAKRGNFDFVAMLIAICVVLVGLLYAPAAIIYFIRRRRGEPTDFFEYEVVDRCQHANRDDGGSHAPDHH
jgi:hypothetical protein